MRADLMLDEMMQFSIFVEDLEKSITQPAWCQQWSILSLWWFGDASAGMELVVCTLLNKQCKQKVM